MAIEGYRAAGECGHATERVGAPTGVPCNDYWAPDLQMREASWHERPTAAPVGLAVAMSVTPAAAYVAEITTSIPIKGELWKPGR